MGVIIDLDQTIVDSSSAEHHRSNRNWSQVYPLIQSFTVYEGISDALMYLDNNKIPICIVTASPSTYCERVLHHWKIPYHYKVCFHDTRNKKPHPEPILKALSLMRRSPSQSISLGDRDIDIVASKDANVNSVACLWGSANPDSLISASPNYTAKNPSELIPIFKQFFKL